MSDKPGRPRWNVIRTTDTYSISTGEYKGRTTRMLTDREQLELEEDKVEALEARLSRLRKAYHLLKSLWEQPEGFNGTVDDMALYRAWRKLDAEIERQG